MDAPTPSEHELLDTLRDLASKLEVSRPGSLDQHQMLVAVLRALIFLVTSDVERRL